MNYRNLQLVILALISVFLMRSIISLSDGYPLFSLMPVSANVTTNTKNKISTLDAKIKALEFLGDNNISLHLHGIESWGFIIGKGKECYHFVGDESQLLTVDVDSTSGKIINFHWGRLAHDSQRTILSLEEAKARAELFLKKKTETPILLEIKIVSANLHKGGMLGEIYRFEWTRVVEDVEIAWVVEVQISAKTGDVVGYQLFDNYDPMKSFTPILNKDKVLEIAKSKIDLLKGWQWVDVHKGVAGGDTQRLIWVAEAKGFRSGEYTPKQGQVGDEVMIWVNINDATGQVYSVNSQWTQPRRTVQLKPPISIPHDILSDDIHAEWARKSILFCTNRRLTKPVQRDKINDEMSLICSFVEGKVILLTPLPFVCRSATMSWKTGRIAFGRWNASSVYIIDPKLSRIGRINDESRQRRSMPFWDSTGTRLAMSGNHLSYDKVGTDDDDIFVSKISEKLSYNSAEYHRCIALLPGRDILPVFTADDKWVVFAHQEKQIKKGWAIYRAKPDIGFQDPKYTKPEKLIEDFVEPERLSPFPDGKRVLISYTGNDYEMKNPPEIIDTAAKTRTPLNLPVLHDADLPKGKPLVPREIAVSPDGKQIAFSALRWSGDPKDDGAILIYTCNLDGSNLKRITPPTDVPLEPYKYPQEGVTGLNAWEKLKPKPNLGTGIKYGDFEARDKLIEKYRKMEQDAKARTEKEKAEKAEKAEPVVQP